MLWENRREKELAEEAGSNWEWDRTATKVRQKKNDKKNVYTASWDSKEKVWTHKYHYAEFILLPILLLLSLLSLALVLS